VLLAPLAAANQEMESAHGVKIVCCPIKKPRHAGAFCFTDPLFYRPASARKAAALSVDSQVNSGSSRPKWP
jgi:hypothetical protein